MVTELEQRLTAWPEAGIISEHEVARARHEDRNEGCVAGNTWSVGVAGEDKGKWKKRGSKEIWAHQGVLGMVRSRGLKLSWAFYTPSGRSVGRAGAGFPT